MANKLLMYETVIKEVSLITKNNKVIVTYKNYDCIVRFENINLILIYKYPYCTPKYYVNICNIQMLYNKYLCKLFIIYKLKRPEFPVQILCERTIIMTYNNIIENINTIKKTKIIIYNLYKSYLGHKIFDELGIHEYPFYKWLLYI